MRGRNRLEHWTTTTGHVRDSFRSEVTARTRRSLGGRVDEIFSGDTMLALPPPFNEYCLARVHAVFATGAAGFTFHKKATTLLEMTTGCGRIHETAWEHAWRRTALEERPRCPEGLWSADRIDEGIVDLPVDETKQIMGWSGEMTRCIAWTTIDRLLQAQQG